MYLKRARFVGRSFAAALANLSTVATPPVLEGKNSAWAEQYHG
jgi:hypothetical protein